MNDTITASGHLEMSTYLVPLSHCVSWSTQDLADLRWAHRHLEHASIAVRLSNALGSPIEQAASLLPERWRQRLQRGTETALRELMNGVMASMDYVRPHAAHNTVHRALVMGTGALGGFFGPAAVLAELPFTTALMMRSIADIAHAQGEDLSRPEARLACLQVFALGGRSHEDDAAESGYYGLRLALAMHLSHQASGSVPGLMQFIQAIAARFGIVISHKAALQAVPIVGAVSGAALNLVFLNHFQDMARGHFTLRRLERNYGVDAVREAYQQIDAEEKRRRRPFSDLEGW